jgi:hypothetical protein
LRGGAVEVRLPEWQVCKAPPKVSSRFVSLLSDPIGSKSNGHRGTNSLELWHVTRLYEMKLSYITQHCSEKHGVAQQGAPAHYTGKIESPAKMSGSVDYGGLAKGTWTAEKAAN